MAMQSQQPVYNWNPNSGSRGGMDIGSILSGNQLGAYLNFPQMLQGAMGQMGAINASNQNAQQNNNYMNMQLMIQKMLSDAAVQQSLYGAQGQLGVQGLINQGQQNLLNNPNWLETQRGNYGTSIQELQNKGLLSLQQAKNQGAMGLIDKLVGSGGLFSGLGGMSSALRGFTSEDGSQRASLPQAQVQSSASPVQQGGASAGAAVPQMPTPMPQMQPNQAALPTNRFAGTPTPSGREYLLDYMKRMGLG